MRLGLIGYGAIGQTVAQAFAPGCGDGVELVAILVRHGRPEASVRTSLEDFLRARPEVVLECAGHQAVREHGVRCLEAGADLVLTSIGALVEDELRLALERAAAAAGRRLVVASAGIGALDILTAAAVGGLDRVTITVRKDPSAWLGTPAEQICDLASLEAPLVLYDGPVRAGAARYPANVNIAAAAALAGLGLERTRLVILADPGIRDHVVEIEAAGAFGRFSFREEVRPTRANPKTGELVAMALIKTVRQLAAPVVIGA